MSGAQAPTCDRTTKQVHSPPRKYLSPVFRTNVAPAITAAKQAQSIVIPNGQSSNNLQYIARLQQPRPLSTSKPRSACAAGASSTTSVSATAARTSSKNNTVRKPLPQCFRRSNSGGAGAGASVNSGGAKVARAASAAAPRPTINNINKGSQAQRSGNNRLQTPPAATAPKSATTTKSTTTTSTATTTAARAPPRGRIVHTVGKGASSRVGVAAATAMTAATRTSSSTATFVSSYSSTSVSPRRNIPTTRSPPSIPVRPNKSSATRAGLAAAHDRPQSPGGLYQYSAAPREPSPRKNTASPSRSAATLSRTLSQQQQPKQQQQQQPKGSQKDSGSTEKEIGTAPSWKSHVQQPHRHHAHGEDPDNGGVAELPDHLVYREPTVSNKQFAHVRPRYLSPPKKIDPGAYRTQHGLNPSPQRKYTFNAMPNVPSRYKSPPKEKQHTNPFEQPVPRDQSFIVTREYEEHKRMAEHCGVSAPHSKYFDPAMYSHAGEHDTVTPRYETEMRKRQVDDEIKKGPTHFRVRVVKPGSFEGMTKENERMALWNEPAPRTVRSDRISVVMEYVRHGVEIPSARPKEELKHVEHEPTMDGQIYYGGGGAGGGTFKRRSNSPVKKAQALEEERARAIVERLHSARTTSPPRVASLPHAYSTMTHQPQRRLANPSTTRTAAAVGGGGRGTATTSPTRSNPRSGSHMPNSPSGGGGGTATAQTRGVRPSTSPQKRELVVPATTHNSRTTQQQQRQQNRGGVGQPPQPKPKAVRVTYYVQQHHHHRSDNTNSEWQHQYLDHQEEEEEEEQEQHPYDDEQQQEEGSAHATISPSPANPHHSAHGGSSRASGALYNSKQQQHALPYVFENAPCPEVHGHHY